MVVLDFLVVVGWLRVVVVCVVFFGSGLYMVAIGGFWV